MKVLIGGNPMGLEKAMPRWQEEYPEHEWVHDPDRSNLANVIGDVDVYVGWISHEQYLAAKQLKWIQSPSSGINYYLAYPELVESDVILCSARGTHGNCLAESAFGMILAFTRQIKPCIEAQQKNEWAIRKVRPNMIELTGSTMCIIGMGAVGRAVASRAKAFEMKVVGVDMFPNNKPDYVDELVGLDEIGDKMAEADVVVVTVPYTAETDHMINAELIGKMKETAMLVGISRGKIIDEDALAEALTSGKLYAAALDVFAKEPLPEDSPLWGIDNLLITPHAAGGTQLEGERIIAILDENFKKFFAGDFPLRNQIDKKRGF